MNDHGANLMLAVGLPELLIILVIIVLIFGARRLAGLGRGLGQAVRGFKDEIDDERGRSAEAEKDEAEQARQNKKTSSGGS